MVDHSRDWLEVSTETRRRRIHTQETMAQHEELLREMQQSLAKSRDARARAGDIGSGKLQPRLGSLRERGTKIGPLHW